MRILACHNYYQQQGGEAVCFSDEVGLLRDHGHEVEAYTLHNNEIDNMSSLSIARRSFYNRDTYRAVRNSIRKFRPDVMHCTNTFPLMSPSVYFAAKAEGVPVLQALHNYRLLCPNALLMRDEQACEECVGKLFAWPAVRHRCYKGSRMASTAVAGMLFAHKAMRTWTNKVDLYYALTEFSRDKFIQGGFPADRIAIKPNFVSTQAPRGDGEGRYAAYVGRLSEEKGIRTLLNAWKQNADNVPLKIIGDGPLAQNVRDAAAADSRIEYAGALPPDKVISVLADAACVVLPSVCYETFGRTIIEAYSVGTPAVVSRMGAMQEIVHHGITGFQFTPGDANALFAAVNDVMGPQEQSLRQAAYDIFQQRYTPAHNYKLLMQLYERVTGTTELSAEPQPAQLGPTTDAAYESQLEESVP